MELKKRLQHEIDTLTKMKKEGGLNDCGEAELKRRIERLRLFNELHLHSVSTPFTANWISAFLEICDDIEEARDYISSLI